MTSGNPIKSAARCITTDLHRDHNQKIIWYTSSKKKAEESLIQAVENVMDALGINGEAIQCTGGAGLPMKAFLLAGFRGGG